MTDNTQRICLVKVRDHRILGDVMRRRGHSVRSLADAVDRKVRRLRSGLRCSRSTIGHLCSGERTNANPDIANAIEDELDVPRGTLFRLAFNPK